MTLLDKLSKVEMLLKHQPGRHDQQRHAGTRGGGGGASSTESSPALQYDAAAKAIKGVMPGAKSNSIPGKARDWTTKGNKVDAVDKAVVGSGMKFEHETSDGARVYSGASGEVRAQVSYSSGSNKTRVSLSNEAALQEFYRR